MSEVAVDRTKAMQMLRDHRIRYQERERVIAYFEQRLLDLTSWKIDEMRKLDAAFRAMGTNSNHVSQWLDEEQADE